MTVLLAEALKPFDLPLSTEAFEQLEQFHQLLLEWNGLMDLTNVLEDEMPIRHYADSLLLLKHCDLPTGASLIDVGSGAGFPGIPLAIARPDLNVVLLESQQKRVRFLNEAIKRLGLNQVRALQGRAEDMARTDLRESFDFACARALAPLNVLCEYLVPFLKIGAKALCWKGPALENELEDGQKAAMKLGALMAECYDLNIPGRCHRIQLIQKRFVCPEQYPRKAGIPTQKPLK